MDAITPREIQYLRELAKKQMEYANRRGIPYVVIVGSQELEAGAATVKDMRTGEQRQVSLDKLATEICNS